MSRVQELAKRAKEASYQLAVVSTAQKDRALAQIAAALVSRKDEIIAANQADMEAAREAGMSVSLLDRLMLNTARIEEIAAGILQVQKLDDPIGEVLCETVQPNGLTVQKVRVPFGVVGINYEARPNVTADAAALTLKTGNAVLLRGSASAIHANRAIVAVMRAALASCKLPVDAIQLVDETDRASAREMMQLNGWIDVLIPRGGASLIRDVVNHATVPVIETGIGNCHIFVDKSAAPDMVIPLLVNAKTQRPSVCNSAEKLLLHKDWPREHMLAAITALQNANVEVRGDAKIRGMFPQNSRLEELPQEEYAIEYLDMIMGVILVEDVGAAIAHINRYGSGHTDAILTQDAQSAEQFLRGVDAAVVNHNASTRFTDGFEFGFGAEIGISTQKLHARGPMGLQELTSYKYLVRGNGQLRP
jgi:glutamate-5-semialdehyde dehydrogenase